MDFNQIQELIRMVGKHKISEFSLREGEFRLVIRSQSAASESASAPMVVYQPTPSAAPSAPAVAPAAAVSAPTPAAAPAAAAPVDEDNNPRYRHIKSPMVGTFYRSSGPDKGPLVKVGDLVDVGGKVCIIEAMKLFNEIDSEIKGKIVKVLVEDASPVEYDQPLFLVDPA